VIEASRGLAPQTRIGFRAPWGLLWADFADYRPRPFFWIWGALLLAFAWLFGSGNLTIQAGDSSVGGAKAWITSEFAIAHMLGVGTLLFHGFFVAVICGLPIVRDEELRIGEILPTALSENGPFDSALLPTPGFVAQRSMPGLLTCTALLLLFYTVESLERDTRARLDAISSA
jgi:hypothetical protein